MSKQNITSGNASRVELLKGINKLANAVVSTLGPFGRNVVFEKDGQIISTKDGVSVAKRIKGFEDPIEEIGANLIKQASIKTADNAGDGTTTSTLLAQTAISRGVQKMKESDNPVHIRNEMLQASKDVIDYIYNNIRQDIKSEDQLYQVATISSNNDEFVGNLITQALNEVGHEGVVHVEESKSGETYLEVVEGMQLDRGYKSHFFVTDNNTMSCTLKDPLILIADQKFSTIKDLVPILEQVSTSGKSLLIIAEDIDNEALATLIVNKARGTLNVCAIKAPEFGDRRKLVLEDIAILTGGTVFDPSKGMRLNKFDMTWLGSARTVTITKSNTTIVDGKGEFGEIEQRVEDLKQQISHSNMPFEIEQLQNRLAKMVGGVALIHIGGFTETEMKERKDRVEDALHATKAAIEEGVIPGGGVALLRAGKEVLGKNPNRTLGEDIVYHMCKAPLYTILHNAGYNDEDIVEYITNLQSFDNFWVGGNISNNLKIIDYQEGGILDPFKVTRSAMNNAISVASTVLLTECIINDIPGENSEHNDPYSMMM